MLEARRRHEQGRLRVAHPERTQALELLGKLEPEHATGHHGVDSLARDQVRRRQRRRSMPGQRAPKRLDRRLLELDSGRHPVAPEAGQVSGAGAEPRVEVVRRDAPAGPRPAPSSSAITTHGRRQRSTSRDATIPTTPGCQPSPATTIAPALACGRQAASAANRMRVSASWRSRLAGRARGPPPPREQSPP